MDDPNNNWLDRTRQTYHQTYNYIKLNQKFFDNPLGKMLFEVRSFADCFEGTEKELEILEQIYKDPIKYLSTKYPKLFHKKQLKRFNMGTQLPLIEWIFFRDSHYKTPLKKEYRIDESYSGGGSRYITFGDIISIRGDIEKEISKTFNKIVKANNFALDNPFMNFPKGEEFNLNEFGGAK